MMTTACSALGVIVTSPEGFEFEQPRREDFSILLEFESKVQRRTAQPTLRVRSPLNRQVVAAPQPHPGYQLLVKLFKFGSRRLATRPGCLSLSNPRSLALQDRRISKSLGCSPICRAVRLRT
jgi:hypothetical protein